MKALTGFSLGAKKKRKKGQSLFLFNEAVG